MKRNCDLCGDEYDADDEYDYGLCEICFKMK